MEEGGNKKVARRSVHRECYYTTAAYVKKEALSTANGLSGGGSPLAVESASVSRWRWSETTVTLTAFATKVQQNQLRALRSRRFASTIASRFEYRLYEAH